MIAKTMAGLEEVLADELKSIGAEETELLQRAVSFKGDKAMMYKANLICRTALRILMPLTSFTVRNEKDLYGKLFDMAWEIYMDVDNTLAVDTIISGKSDFTNSLYISQKTKDAVVDRFYMKTGKRPSVDISNPDIRINLHISANLCNVSLDSSGTSLHKRGYRQHVGLAPINEVLASGLIKLTGWKCDCSFTDPMCGSGTFLIEAAMMANNIPAGFYRKEFGFQKWKDYNFSMWEKIYNESIANFKEFEFGIYGSDISSEAIRHAEANIKYARLHKDIFLGVSSFQDTNPKDNKGILIFNPPYGERIRQEKITEFYKEIGNTLKRKYSGHEAWIISSDLEALKYVGLKPSAKIKLFNGPLECLFAKFELYEGSKKGKGTIADISGNQ